MSINRLSYTLASLVAGTDFYLPLDCLPGLPASTPASTGQIAQARQ